VTEPTDARTSAFTIHSEERGPHWIAWATRGNDTKPVLSAVVVGETKEEAEARAAAWAAEVTAKGYSW
jgi:hypothetical protein